MASKSLVGEKSIKFAIRVVKAFQYLSAEKKEYYLSRQLLRAGTNPGSMVREALNAESSKDFIHKLSIAQKEIGETIYWLELLEAAQYLDPIQAQSLKKDAEEILKMLTSIIKTTKKKLSAPPTNN